MVYYFLAGKGQGVYQRCSECGKNQYPSTSGFIPISMKYVHKPECSRNLTNHQKNSSNRAKNCLTMEHEDGMMFLTMMSRTVNEGMAAKISNRVKNS